LRIFDEEELDFEDEFELEDDNSEDEVESNAGTPVGLQHVILG
jgi:hypothetical protein